MRKRQKKKNLKSNPIAQMMVAINKIWKPALIKDLRQKLSEVKNG